MNRSSLINQNESLERQNAKLLQISEVLMRRVEQATTDTSAAYAHFQRAVLLEDQVRERTQDLERALDLLNESNARLADANQQTEAARADLANAIETVQEGFGLFDADEKLVLCNSRFGMHMPDIRPALEQGLDFQTYVKTISQSRYLSMPEGQTRERWVERRMRHHEDEHVVFNVAMKGDIWVQVSEHRTPAGGTVILQTDVTEMIRLEREERGKMLDTQDRMIRATLEHIRQGVCIFDADRRLIGWNRRIGSMLTLPMTRFRRGSHFDDLFAKVRDRLDFSDPTGPDRLVRWVHGDDNSPSLSFEVDGGAGRTFDIFAERMPNSGFVISFNDVTAERAAVRAMYQANDALEQRVLERTLELEDALSDAERANASKSRFVAAASHDLLQPLSAAKLYIASAVDQTLGEGGQDILEKAQNALLSVEDILQALLDISRLEAGQDQMDVGPVHINQILHQLRDEFLPHAAQKGLDLRVVASSAVVESDPSYLRRILQNLIANAIRYTTRGKILIGARHRGHAVRVEVWDTGPGIAEEDQDTIFKEFQRLNARASATEGMGLGLAIVERACARLGHPLAVESKPGRGSVFHVSIPRMRNDRVVQPTGDASRSEVTSAGTGLIVLLIEDDSAFRAALTHLLETWEVSVLDVANVAEAEALLSEIAIIPDALLLDFQLGSGKTGLDALSQIQNQHGPIPARIITADRSATVRSLCAARDVEILHKPIDTEALADFLRGIPAAAPVRRTSP